MTTTTITTSTGRNLRVTAAKTGTNFGWVGLIKAMNGQTIDSTPVYPTAKLAKEAALTRTDSIA